MSDTAFSDFAILVLVIAVLATWRNCTKKPARRAALYTPPPPKRGIAYPGIPTVLTDAFAQAVDHGTSPLPGPFSVAGADPDELAQYIALITRRVMAAAPPGALNMLPTGIDNASVDVDSLGNKMVSVCFLAHESNSGVSIKLNATLAIKVNGNIYMIDLKPYSAPVDSTVASLASLSPFATYEPVVSPII
jgi:hypothetical protein